MNVHQRAKLHRYVAKQRNEVEGWFSRTDAEILFAVQCAQDDAGLSGSVVEIGLHHGKSFISLCLGLNDEEIAYGIDLFENQSLNLDNSGRGSESQLDVHLLRFGIERTRVVLDGRPSQEVTPSDILTAGEHARIFSIDGGHWREVVVNDLRLAESVIADWGIIALDDFHRSEWPDVSAGYFAWREKSEKDIVPFAIGFNKLYLCFRDRVHFYQSVLRSSKFLGKFLVKTSKLQNEEVLVYQSFMLPEFGFIRRLHEHLRLYYPETYFRTRSWRARIHGRS